MILDESSYYLAHYVYQSGEMCQQCQTQVEDVLRVSDREKQNRVTPKHTVEMVSIGNLAARTHAEFWSMLPARKDYAQATLMDGLRVCKEIQRTGRKINVVVCPYSDENAQYFVLVFSEADPVLVVRELSTLTAQDVCLVSVVDLK